MIRSSALPPPRPPVPVSIVAGVITCDLSGGDDYFIASNNADLTGIVVLGVVPGVVNEFQLDLVSDGNQRIQPVFFDGSGNWLFPFQVPPTTSAVAGAIDTMFFSSALGNGVWKVLGGDNAFQAPS